MDLHAALTTLADYLDLDAAELIAYAEADPFTGWDDGKGDFPNGSIWGVEGKVLFALVRALKPASVLELGVYHGCSTTHLIAALQANGSGTVTSVDHHSGDGASVDIGDAIPDAQRADFHYVEQRGQHYLAKLKDNSQPFIFEDMQHDVEGTAELWVLGVQKLQPGGVMISHDSEHPTAGPDVRAGVALAGVTGTISLLIEPADCGLLVYRKPGQWIDPELPLTKEELKGVIKGDALEVKADGEAKLNRRRAPDKVTRTPAKKTAAKK